MVYKQESVKPYSTSGTKAEQVGEMFDNIAPAYDRSNHLLSWGLDRAWRTKAIKALGIHSPKHILDISTGTGDFAILTARLLSPVSIVGADISEGMMDVGRRKVREEGLDGTITFRHEDCTRMSFPDHTFDAVTVAFGVRNYEHLDLCLSEMRRVLKEDGHLLILELSTPPRFPMRQLFWLYAHTVIPAAGLLFSNDRDAYPYLTSSVEAFPQAEEMEAILRKSGLGNVSWRRLTSGICTMYLASPSPASAASSN